MLRYLISRIVSMVPLLVVITAFTFIIGQYGAGDLAAYLAGTRGDAAKGFDVELYQQFRQELGMDDPIFVRYGRWLWNALHGDFGRSYVMMGDPEILICWRTPCPIPPVGAGGARRCHADRRAVGDPGGGLQQRPDRPRAGQQFIHPVGHSYLRAGAGGHHFGRRPAAPAAVGGCGLAWDLQPGGDPAGGLPSRGRPAQRGAHHPRLDAGGALPGICARGPGARAGGVERRRESRDSQCVDSGHHRDRPDRTAAAGRHGFHRADSSTSRALA